MTTLVVISVAVILVLIARRFYRQLLEQRLRDNPPERRLIEVSLPRDIDDSAERMKGFYRKIASAALGDTGQRRRGQRQVDIVYLAEAREAGAAPVLRFLVYADPDKMGSIKRAIKNSFEGMADVVELEPDSDPMRRFAGRLRQPVAGTENPAPEAGRGQG